MSLSFEDLIAGPKLPAKEVYIDTLQDSVLIQPVPLERYREYKGASEEDQSGIVEICIAESISQQSGMTLEAAKEINAKVRAKLHPAAFDEISRAVMVTMFGEARLSGNG